MPLKQYHKKRRFSETPEPQGAKRGAKAGANKCQFVVQEHHATRLHFDFRLEMSGVLKSWAVPKGPSMNPSDKRLAVMVEDHPIEYGGFSGAIPEGNYGAGEVRIWDKGTYEAVGETPIDEQLQEGKLTFLLKGKKLKGEFHMVEMKGRGENNWLLFKHEDNYADHDWTLEPILHYGSRSQKSSATKKIARKNALETVLKSSKRKAKRKPRVVAKTKTKKSTA